MRSFARSGLRFGRMEAPLSAIPGRQPEPIFSPGTVMLLRIAASGIKQRASDTVSETGHGTRVTGPQTR